MSILHNQTSDPFWAISPAQDQKSNPLGFHCAPNAATPDYIAYHDIENFVAYAFTMCWLTPQDYTGWAWLQANDIRWLREHFLQALEVVLLGIYDGDYADTLADDGKRYEGFDCGEFDSLSVSDNEDEEYRTEDHLFQWMPFCVEQDGTVAFELRFNVMESPDNNPSFGEDPPIWLAPEGYADRAKARKVIAHARKVNWRDIDNKSLKAESKNISAAWEKVVKEVVAK